MFAPAVLLLMLAGSQTPATRPFRMGFTPWPYDLTLEAVQGSLDFAHKHGDVVSIMMIGGIPWPEALAGKPYSADVERALAYKPPAGKSLFLSVSPLDMGRKGLAPYWGEKDNLPLPPEWATKAFNSPEVKKAFLKFTLDAVGKMKPEYLCITVEANALLSNSKAAWPAFKEFYRETYKGVKAKYPTLPVFFTTEVNHYKKLNNDAKGSPQEAEVAELMKSSDIFAMSFYPHMAYDLARPLPEGFFDFARGFGKPIAISECGMTSRDTELKSLKLTLFGSENEQKVFFDRVFSAAQRDKYRFVITFCTTDFEKLCNKLSPPVDDIARIWQYCGLQTGDFKPKPALKVWDETLARPYKATP